MKKLPALLLLLTCITCAKAQYPIVFNQFPQNPFHFNPSFAASNGYAETNVFYRKQWLGIENAPEFAAFNIQAPVGRNVSLGLNVYADKTILLKNTGAIATFGYRIRIDRHQHFNFGISGGLGLNNFDQEAIANTNDPVLINALQNSKYLIGQVGINYHFKNLTIGFSLPTLFDNKANTTENFQEIKFNEFDNKFGSLSYTFNLKNIQFTPTILYRSIAQQQDQWELMAMTTFRNFIWIGLSYREEYGMTGLIGVRLKNRLRIGYAYEYPTGKISKATTGSHEIFMGYTLGNRNREEEIFAQQMRRDSLNQVAKLQQEQKNLLREEDKEIPVAITPTQPQPENKTDNQPEPVKPEVAQHQPIGETEAPAKKDAPLGELIQKNDPAKSSIPPGYYLVVGVYKLEENALRNFGNLRSAGHNPQMMFVEEKGYFYVYLFHSLSRAEALRELEKIKSMNKFYGAWIYFAQ